MKPTKQKIIAAAVTLFNQLGVNNITLRDIAAEAGISTGNLAYHFKNKDFIIEAAFKQMEEERDEILAGVQQIPSFENINRQLLPLLEVAHKYQFFYLDMVHLIRVYPGIAALHRRYIDQSIQYIRAVIDYSVGSGNMRPEHENGHYNRLAQTVWMLMNFWIEKTAIIGAGDLQIEELRKSIWDLVIPHLTEKGRHNFSYSYASFAH